MDIIGLTNLAKDQAKKCNLDPALVCAVVEQESSWSPWAMRFEPGFLRRYIKPPVPEAPTTGEIARATSWGLLQIMGQVALEMGFEGRFYSELCEPETGLLFGCKKLAKCLEARGGDQHKALLMWNGGSNLSYPDQVLARVRKYW
jgi:soluble lytic murein transglycosylase-like protein